MTTVILIAILIVLLILACTFGLLRRSGKKDRRDQFNDVMTSIAASNADPSIPLSAEAAAMLQQQYPYLMTVQQVEQQQQQQQQQNYLIASGQMGNGSLNPDQGMDPRGSQYSLRGSSPRHSQHSSSSPHHHHLSQQQQPSSSQQRSGVSGIPSPSHYPQADPRAQPSPHRNAAVVTAAAAVPYPPHGYIPAPAMDRGTMGSAEAEFQNDFIEVFPMQHLEPKPDLN